jgi:hypothetical protein
MGFLSPPRRLKKDIPKSLWEPLFFEEINERTDTLRMYRLRERRLPLNDREIRIWEGFGLTSLIGYRFVQTGGRWMASYLYCDSSHKKDVWRTVLLGVPKSGWGAFWSRLEREGIWTLPDESVLPNDGISVFDGTSYVVECQRDDLYRTYLYSNPDCHPKWPQAARMLSMMQLIRREFDIARAVRERNAAARRAGK